MPLGPSRWSMIRSTSYLGRQRQLDGSQTHSCFSFPLSEPSSERATGGRGEAMADGGSGRARSERAREAECEAPR